MKLLNDKYRRVRGGYSRLLELSCAKCGNYLCVYQKDGPGIIKRLYLDRIFNEKLTKGKKIECPSCSNLLGKLGVYDKENRPAYSLVPGTISKKIVKVNRLT